MRTRVEQLLDKLDKGIVDNDVEFLECLIDLDYRLKKLETKEKPSHKAFSALNRLRSRNCK